MKRMMKHPCGISLLIGAILILVISCGKKGPPIVPRYDEPPVTINLQGTLQEDALTLAWMVPKKSKGITGFIVYRSRTSTDEPECKTCPVLFERVIDIPILEKKSEEMENREMTHTEVLEPGFRYIFKVNPYMEGGQVGKDSNYFVVTFEPDKNSGEK